MSATHAPNSTPAASAKLYLAFELGWTSWNLAFTTGMAQKPRLRTIAARDLDGLQHEIRRAKQRFDLADDAPVVSCYEAGRDGFWLHRYLEKNGIANSVVDASSIEVNRRARRAKSDRLDVAKLLTMLIRYHGGEHKLWSVVRVPSPDDEDRRQPPASSWPSRRNAPSTPIASRDFSPTWDLTSRSMTSCRNVWACFASGTGHRSLPS